MQKLSCELSRKKRLRDARRSASCAELHENLFEYCARKINTQCDLHRQTLAAIPIGWAAPKIHLTEFLVKAKRVNERRWSICNAQMKGQLMLLNINEVARDYLRVSRSTVYRLIEQGELRSVKVRGCTRVSEQEINLFIESNGTPR